MGGLELKMAKNARHVVVTIILYWEYGTTKTTTKMFPTLSKCMAL
jgi:hypothetical protein